MRPSALIAVLVSLSIALSAPAAGVAAEAGSPTAATARKKKPKPKPKPKPQSETPPAHHSASGTVTVTTVRRAVCEILGFNGATKTTTTTDLIEVSLAGSGTPGGRGGRSPTGRGTVTVSSRRRVVAAEEVTGSSPVRPTNSDTGWRDQIGTNEDFGSLVRIEGGRLVVDLKSTTRQRVRKAVVRPADGTTVPVAFDETRSDPAKPATGCSEETTTTTTAGTVNVRRH